jgi:hypothetical protein
VPAKYLMFQKVVYSRLDFNVSINKLVPAKYLMFPKVVYSRLDFNVSIYKLVPAKYLMFPKVVYSCLDFNVSIYKLVPAQYIIFQKSCLLMSGFQCFNLQTRASRIFINSKKLFTRVWLCIQKLTNSCQPIFQSVKY